MNKSDLIKKLEDAVNSFKQEVDKNDGSTLATVANSIGSRVDNLVDAISSNKKAQKFGERVKRHWGELEDAIIKGDKKISASAMSAVQKGIYELKKKMGEENDAPIYTYKGTPFAESEPNRSKVFKVGKFQEAPVAKPKAKASAGDMSETRIITTGDTPNKSKVFKVGRFQEVPVGKLEKK